MTIPVIVAGGADHIGAGRDYLKHLQTAGSFEDACPPLQDIYLSAKLLRNHCSPVSFTTQHSYKPHGSSPREDTATLAGDRFRMMARCRDAHSWRSSVRKSLALSQLRA